MQNGKDSFGLRSDVKHKANKKWLLIVIGILFVVFVLIWFMFNSTKLESAPILSEHSDKSQTTKTYQQILIKLPADDSPHDYQTEWWYYNGHLKTDDGRHFSFHYAVFLENSLFALTAVHVSVTDQQTGERYTDQYRTGGNPSVGSVDGFDFTFGDWQMSRSEGHDLLKMKSDDFMFNLKLVDGVPPIFHGGTGLLDFDKAGKSYYYTRPRMPVTGVLELKGKQFKVSGVAWFDHQWGDFDATLLSWDWFSLQLDDGTDIMLYELHDSQGNTVLNSGTISKNNLVLDLTENDFTTKSLSTWTSKATGITYPMGWHVQIPGRFIDLTLQPWIKDSEFDGRVTTHNAYWEGAVQITGTYSGKGFVELGGYSLRH